MNRDSWCPDHYLKFGDERTRAAAELLARVPLRGPRLVVDLGCGPGNSTALLAARFPEAHLIGVDSSAAMLAQARAGDADTDWIEADAAHWTPPRPADLIFANAVFQWVGDHPALFPALLDRLAPGGVLAVQMPQNFLEPSHRLMRDIAATGPWAGRLAGVRADDPLLDVAAYYDLLAPRARVDLWQTAYHHVLDDAAAIVDWVAGTGLRPFLDPLPPAEQADFRAAYHAAIDIAYPPRADGKRLFRFPRLFIVAVKEPRA